MTPRNTLLPHMWYLIKFGRCGSSRLSVSRTVPKKIDVAEAPPPWDVGVADPLKTCFPHLSYYANFGHSRSNHTSLFMEIPQNFTPHVPPFKSLNVIGTDTDRSATYGFLLAFYSNNGPISYRFRDKGRYLQKKFPVHLTPSLGVSLGIL